MYRFRRAESLGDEDLWLFNSANESWQFVGDRRSFASQEGSPVIEAWGPLLSESGRIAMWALLGNDDVFRPDSEDLSAISSVSADGLLETLVQEGQQINLLSSEATVSSLGGVSMSASGQLTFGGRYFRSTRTTEYPVIWRQDDGQPMDVAVTAENWDVDIPAGWQVESFTPTINRSGRIAFTANYEDGSEHFSDVWAEDQHGQLQLIARTGDTLEVAEGDTRIINYVGLIGFDDKSRVGYRAGFIDGSTGAFLSYTVAIPEPSSEILGLMALLVLTMVYDFPVSRAART